MKNISLTICVITLIAFLYACTKQEIKNQDFVPGLRQDDPTKVAKVPLMQSTSNVKFAMRGRPTKGDKTSPIVSIYSPVAGSISGIVNITGKAVDKSTIDSVVIKINGERFAKGFTSDFSFAWNTTDIPNDAYQIVIEAYDFYGNSGSATVTVTKNVVIIPPPDVNPSVAYQIAMPPVRNQGSEGSCAAFAVGYAARSVDWYNKTNATSYNDAVNLFSPEFLYNKIKFPGDCYTGAAMQPALDTIKNSGICTWATMPYSTTNGCSTLPNASQYSEGINYKINSYVKLYTTDKEAIKALVRDNKPVIISITIDNSFLAAKTDFIWSYSTGGSVGHAVVICGYDDAKNAYRIMNSFGTDWGGGGFCWIDYDFFLLKTGTYCYAIQ